MLRSAEPLPRSADQRTLDELPVKAREPFIDALVSVVDTLRSLSTSNNQKD